MAESKVTAGDHVGGNAAALRASGDSPTVIRRYYILPLRPGVEERRVREFLDVLRAADRFIPGLVDSSAALDLDSRTVVWENTFVDEASYSGPYMVHPFHIAAIDNYVMADSPECLTQDIYATRFQTPDATQPLRAGLRRVLLLNVESPEDAEAIRAVAATAEGMEMSAFGADDVGWVSAKGRPWTHIWEQAFTDAGQLRRYLSTRDGIARSSREGFSRLGVDLRSLQVFTVPLDLKAPEQQTPSVAPRPDVPVRYTMTACVDIDDADRFVELLERLYDPVMAEAGSPARRPAPDRRPGIPPGGGRVELAARLARSLQRHPGEHLCRPELERVRQGRHAPRPRRHPPIPGRPRGEFSGVLAAGVDRRRSCARIRVACPGRAGHRGRRAPDARR